MKRVQQSCLNDHINTAVEASNEACFATCGARNITSDCWITCFYEGVLGSEVAKGGALAGMPLAELDAAWLGAFREVDPAKGGCAAMPAPTPPPGP